MLWGLLYLSGCAPGLGMEDGDVHAYFSPYDGPYDKALGIYHLSFISYHLSMVNEQRSMSNY